MQCHSVADIHFCMANSFNVIDFIIVGGLLWAMFK